MKKNNFHKKNIGAYLYRLNISIIVYADDIILLSPSYTQLKLLLDTCGEYSSLGTWKYYSSSGGLSLILKSRI